MEFTSRIEEELKCPCCRQLYVNALLLPCSHSICLTCAIHLGNTHHSRDVISTTAAVETSPSDVIGPVMTGVLGDGTPPHLLTTSTVCSTAPIINGNARRTSITSPGQHDHFIISAVDFEQFNRGEGGVGSGTGCVGGGVGDAEDKASVVSETDSGLESNGSRPNSYVGTPSIGCLSITKPTIGNLQESSGCCGNTGFLTCPRCHRVICVEGTNAQEWACWKVLRAFPRNVTLERIVERYRDARNIPITCQVCCNINYNKGDSCSSSNVAGQPTSSAVTPTPLATTGADASSNLEPCNLSPRGNVNDPLATSAADDGTLGSQQNPKIATVMCELCELFYCSRECHDRSQLSSVTTGDADGHSLMSAVDGRAMLAERGGQERERERCMVHREEVVSLQCTACRRLVCNVCVETRQSHCDHLTLPLSQASKTQKSELSQMLHALSDKVKAGAEFMQRLRSLQDQVESNRIEFESVVLAQCAALIDAIEARKRFLLATIREEATQKHDAFGGQMAQCSASVHSSTGLLQFSIEALKESDSSSFLQISETLIPRIMGVTESWTQELRTGSCSTAHLELSLDARPVQQAIESLNFLQLKVPKAPEIVEDHCFVDGNAVTIAWRSQSSRQDNNCGHGFILEICNAHNSIDFKQVYRGNETVCTVEGLQFDAEYKVRVKAYSDAGHSPYSQIISMKTSKVAYFSFDTTSSVHADLLFTNDNLTVTTSSFDDRVVFATIGLSNGIHYWEVSVDRYENNKDPAFGVVRRDVTRDRMIGKDDRGWSMYVDNCRSWFMHAGRHSSRMNGGIRTASVVGILLDLRLGRGTLSFYINGRPHGPVAFSDLLLGGSGGGKGGHTGVFYPAVSLNRNIQLTLQPGLALPFETLADNSD